jgi:preprotein translocase subunit SecG
MLSSLSFTGTLADTDSKIIDKTEANAPKTAAPAAATPAKEAEPTTKTTAPATPAESAPEKK